MRNCRMSIICKWHQNFFCDFSKENYNFDNLNYIEAETINVERYLQSSGIDDDIEISNTKIPFTLVA